MTSVAVALAITLPITNGVALAQGVEDPMLQLRACFLMEHTERQNCLDRLSRTMASRHGPAAGEENWIISETTSPVDYSPIISATTSSRGGSTGPAMKLSIRCSGKRTDLVVDGPEISGRDDYAISLRVNDQPALQLPAITSASGAGVAIGGDVVRLLQSIPDKGELALHLSSGAGDSTDAIFALGGFESVREKMTAACKWPRAIARPKTKSDDR